jgi:hypothetical protein
MGKEVLMKTRTLIVTFVAALVIAPVAALAEQSASGLTKTNAARDCTVLKAKMGGPAFATAYPTFGACVSSFAALEQQNSTSAEQACRAEQGDATFSLSHNDKTFDEFYGTGKKHANAFGNCVSLKARNSSSAAQQAIQNPARTCRALRTAMISPAFASLYGTNASHSNAFGKCVSKIARDQAPALSNAAKTCSTEQSNIAFAATHGGKTFAQFYGTNADLSNAFGQCVSQKAKAAAQEHQQSIVNAAKSCYAERASNKAAFDQKYGTGRNAFGKCVSANSSSGG